MPDVEARRIIVRGVVQGVGFRPFVYRVARAHGVRGWVRNDGDGVLIHAEAVPDTLDALTRALRTAHPPAAVVASVECNAATFVAHDVFAIRTSDVSGTPTTRISPDLCVCVDCTRELRDPEDRRCGYAYINCTNCGPRYSIIRSLPYDRARTTMADWPLCPRCRAEYDEPADRRYHAQPVACPACGPAYRLVVENETTHCGPEAIARASAMLSGGSILAVKGIGGYHLACDARRPDTVRELRARKFRKEKPFALMASDLAVAESLAMLDETHRALLVEPARPIVLARARTELDGVAPGVHDLGIMLPYAPLHHVLFDAGAPDPLVLTSANRSSEPIAYRDDEARTRLVGLADAFLVGERPIHRRVDDSVVAVRRGAPFVMRRARGYAPASVASIETDHPILAVGADLKNTIALAHGSEVFLSQHIGDLGDVETDRAFRETIDDLLAMYAIDSRELVVAHDMHPEYVSTRVALALPAARHVAVQHHDAHIASVLLEHGRLDERVVGVALDGTGFGHDGTIWGGEILYGSANDGFARRGGLAPVRIPGGDAAARHPAQAAAAYLDALDPTVLEAEPFRFPRRFRDAQTMVKRDVRCFTSTSTGRLFDAAAGVCGFTREISFEGQAAIWLEQLAGNASGTAAGAAGAADLDPRRLVADLVEARLRGDAPATIARRFHGTLASALAASAIEIARRSGATTLVLAGGVWQNRLLLDCFEQAVGSSASVLLSGRIPCNDGGIAAGQVALARARS